jgi:hypothetical protein
MTERLTDGRTTRLIEAVGRPPLNGNVIRHRSVIGGVRRGCVTLMRDRRFIAAHRGGPLVRADHLVLARWAADCAERVLPIFASQSSDPRPQYAINILRSWADGTVKTGDAMKASLAAHAAAREAKGKAAIAAARATGQAVATAHAADHSMGALLYALKALEASGVPSDSEMDLQLAKLPEHLRPQVSSGVKARLKTFGVAQNSGRRHMNPEMRRPN